MELPAAGAHLWSKRSWNLRQGVWLARGVVQGARSDYPGLGDYTSRRSRLVKVCTIGVTTGPSSLANPVHFPFNPEALRPRWWTLHPGHSILYAVGTVFACCRRAPA